MRRGGEEVLAHGRYVQSVEDDNAYLAAGVAGLGILWLPEYMARGPQSHGELVRLFEDWQLDRMPLSLAFPAGRHVSRKLRVFIDWIVELLARQAPAILPPATVPPRRSPTAGAGDPPAPGAFGRSHRVPPAARGAGSARPAT